jgi:hypothetical protein
MFLERRNPLSHETPHNRLVGLVGGQSSGYRGRYSRSFNNGSLDFGTPRCR